MGDFGAVDLLSFVTGSMPAISASAPGKIILFGEHAVVYGQPAIAVPVNQVKAKAIVIANPMASPGKIHVQAPAIELDSNLDELAKDHPIASAIYLTVQALKITRPPACTLRITSSIPVASGLGSGAAVTVAVIRALSTFIGKPISDEETNSIAFEVEKIYHGTPSGIDNTVVTYSRPVYFLRDQPIELLKVPHSFTIIIANTGITSPTRVTVGDVRQAWQSYPDRVEPIFSAIGKIVEQARRLIEHGEPYQIGPLMSEDHHLLQKLGVSSNELDQLVGSALEAGALGAKLSGGGRGGNIIALADPEHAPGLAEILRQSGAAQTIITTVST